ncbi:galactose-3-O-sulfotransferase 2-like [Protopterus annectens]|uniref:galactose-3-O-sulfotransferase 2-like n=1 Tax=Protopterus annectens TaxID=7888 RepID=UPI001CF9FA80|nr:galactose-3-O-sulfotransferase 2-like [Protopterus annectens]
MKEPSLLGYGVSSYRSCSPKTHLMFLKTHKTGSTTVQNILFRYADGNNLSVALSRTGSIHLGYPQLFSEDFVKRSETGQKFDIMANHLKFNLPEISKVMHYDTFYFSIIRNPIFLAESSSVYFNTLNGAKDLNEYMKSPMSYYDPSNVFSFLAKNSMWYDFGFDHNHKNEAEYFELAIGQIESAFHLILLSEYFDESMILLKEVLCWNMDDVIYFKLNGRSRATIQNLNWETIEKLKVWNSLDWKMYLHFNKTFWRTISKVVGLKRLEKEVQLLKQKQKDLLNICVQGGTALRPHEIMNSVFKPLQVGNSEILGYNLRTGLKNNVHKQCESMILPEPEFTQQIYEKQYHKKVKLHV